MQHQLEIESIFNQYKRIINESVDFETIADKFERDAYKYKYGTVEYLQRLALLAHRYKGEYYIQDGLVGWLMNTAERDKYDLKQIFELKPDSKDFEIFFKNYKKGLQDIIDNGEDSYFWDPSFDYDYFNHKYNPDGER